MAIPTKQRAGADRDFLRTALRRFATSDTTGPALLLAATVVALVWANSPWRGGYAAAWGTHVRLAVGSTGFDGDLRHVVNDGLMALFFFVVALEIKRELVAGELSSPRKAMLPALAALGGMIVPALIYLAVNAGGADARGWGIPMATDIAFALGALALFGRSLPSSLRIFLLSLAIVDDVGAILVIALAYTGGVDLVPLAVAVALTIAIVAVRRLNVAPAPVYLVASIGVWVAAHEAGVHATLAGVALGLLTPARPRGGEDVSAAERLEHLLHPWSGYAIVPLFALANAGVEISLDSMRAAFTSRLGLGIVAGLVAGKLAGISATTWLATRARLSPLPEGARWRDLNGVAALAGIGFTVSLFMAGLAFEDGGKVDQAKIAILAGSLAASALGALIFRTGRRR